MSTHTTAPDVDDRSLIRAAVGGDRTAVAHLIDRLGPAIQRRAARALALRRWQSKGRPVRQELDDLTQEVFVALFERGGRVLLSWDPERGLSLEGFAGLVAERQVASILRSGRRSPWTEDPTDAELLAEQLEDPRSAEASVLDADLLDHLLDRFRAQATPMALHLFDLLWVRELPIDAVCSETQLSADAVYAWRSRIRKTLRRLGEDLLSENASPPRRALGGSE